VSGDELTSIGHNTAAGQQLRQAIERIESLTEAKKDIAEDISNEYSMLKGLGLNTKIVRKIIKMRTQDKAERDQEAAETELYLHALGML
jgi:uncharacterized protein (UPF0335 family)